MQGIGLERIMNDKFDARNCVGGCNPMKGLAREWDFLHEADEMLYNVKRSQRNSICVKDFCNLEADSKC